MNKTPIFAINPRLKDQAGNIQRKYHRGYAEPGCEEQIIKMLTRKDMPQMLSEIRDKQRDEVKDELPTICPHYSQFRNNHRAQADIIPEAFTFKTCVDVDEKSLVEQAIKRALEVNEDEMSDWFHMVEYIDHSPRMKTHIWLRLPVGKTIEETQQAFCEEIEVPYDASCITPERFINMTGDEVYRADSWLQPLSEEEVEERREAFLLRGLDVDGRPLKSPETPTQNPIANANMEPASERTRYISLGVMKEKGLEESDFLEEGGRHTAVKMFLKGATPLLSKAEVNGVLTELMPQHWNDNNIQKLVNDFYAKYDDPSRPMYKYQEKLFTESRRLKKTAGTSVANAAADIQKTPVNGDTAALTEIYLSTQPPRLPEKLPKLVKIVTSKTPDDLKPTVSQGMFPPLGVYPRDLRFLYIDNQYRELRINCLTVGGTGSGKDTSLKQPLKHLTGPMVERDKVNRQRLKEFNEKYNSTKSNKDKPKRPDDLIIQKVGADLTPARLSQLMDDSQGAFLYTQLNEFEQWYGIEGIRGQSCTFKNLKLADDEDNPFGQERAGAQSVNYMGPLGLNWNASTTPNKLQVMFRYSLIDGPVSRICLATTPDVGLAAPMPRYGIYDEAYDKALEPYIERLKEATGEIICKPASRLIERLKAECDQYTVVSQDEVFDNLSHRALVHTFRKACLLYAANGMKWEKAIEGFCRWSLHYDLWLKLHFFADQIRNANSQTQTSKRGPRNLLEQISTKEDRIFTYRDAVSVRLKNNKDEACTGNMLSQWKSRGYIEDLGNGRFRKLTTS